MWNYKKKKTNFKKNSGNYNNGKWLNQNGIVKNKFAYNSNRQKRKFERNLNKQDNDMYNLNKEYARNNMGRKNSQDVKVKAEESRNKNSENDSVNHKTCKENWYNHSTCNKNGCKINAEEIKVLSLDEALRTIDQIKKTFKDSEENGDCSKAFSSLEILRKQFMKFKNENLE